MKQSLRIPVPAVGFNPPVYICNRTTKPFTLDGNIHKEFWADAPFTDDFVDIEGPHMPTPRFRTRAKMLWDDNNLYISALLEGTEIWAHLTERDCVIFQDNDFEIFIDPDSDTQQYIEYEMNARNTVWDLLLTKAYRDNGKAINGFDLHGLKTAVHINGVLNDPKADNKEWSVEVVIPFSAISECNDDNRTPNHGEYYRINFSRVQWLVDFVDGNYHKRINPVTEQVLPEDNWVWSPTGVINIHYPELWGFLFFNDGSHSELNFSIPEDEKIKWELRKLYYAEQAYMDHHGSYTNSLTQLTDLLQSICPNNTNHTVAPLPYTIETTTHTFEIHCPNTSGTGKFILCSDGKIKSIGKGVN
ncbi:MAG: carbohydrate-binding family 9-like protein [Herbinix sp.]|jgi:hypothetical protein|nr:carbohydrate-binding family 9-like protein [Herbinix sp.]